MDYTTQYETYMNRLYDRIKSEIEMEIQNDILSDTTSDSSSESSSDLSNDNFNFYVPRRNMLINHYVIRKERTPRNNIGRNFEDVVYENGNIYDDYGKNKIEVNIEKVKKLLKFEENKFIVKIPEPPKICPVMQEEMREGYKTKCNHYLSYEALFGWIKEGKKSCPVCRENMY
jgi:hypothetical protein